MLANVSAPINMPRRVEGSTHFAQNCKKIALISIAITCIAATGSFFAGLLTAKTAFYTITSISTGILAISVMVNEYIQNKRYLPQVAQQADLLDSGRNEGKRAIQEEENIEAPLAQVAHDEPEQLRALIQHNGLLSRTQLQFFQDLHTRIQFSNPILVRTVQRILGTPVLINRRTALYLALHQSNINNPNLIEFLLEHEYHYSTESRLITENIFKRYLDVHQRPGPGLQLIIKHSPNGKVLFDYLSRMAMVDDNSLEVQDLTSGSRNIARNVVLDYTTWHIQNALPALRIEITSNEICGDVAGIIAQYLSFGIDPTITDKIQQDNNQHLRQTGN